jgi:hypothetical protein
MTAKQLARPRVPLLALLFLGAALLAGSGPARAQDASRGAPPRVIELEALTIEGKVAKPTVFYVLRRSQVSYENLKLHRVFVDRILDEARRNRF